MGEKQGFKRRAFGGFDRKDVINYIEELAAERNALAAENEKLRSELDRCECIAENCDDGENIKNADEILASLEKEYSILCADVDVNLAHVKCETDNVEERLRKLSDALKDAGGRISALRTSLNKENK